MSTTPCGSFGASLTDTTVVHGRRHRGGRDIRSGSQRIRPRLPTQLRPCPPQDLHGRSSFGTPPPKRWADTTDYSLWVGSAGAGLAAAIGDQAQHRPPFPAPAAVISQDTGYSTVTGTEFPTYAYVGSADGISPPDAMQARTSAIQSHGIPTQLEVFRGLPHGFSLGEGTPPQAGCSAGWCCCLSQ